MPDGEMCVKVMGFDANALYLGKFSLINLMLDSRQYLSNISLTYDLANKCIFNYKNYLRFEDPT